jgi:hypothetical protein
MDDYTASTYGERIAERYDDWYATLPFGGDLDATVGVPPRRGQERAALVIRYAYPAELDLVARLAGLRLRERWGDWDRTPIVASSPKHVSVWERPR